MNYKKSTKAEISNAHKELTERCEKLEDHTKLLEDKLATAVTEAQELKDDYTEAMESLKVNSRRLISLSEENNKLRHEAKEQIEAVLQTQISLNKVISEYKYQRWVFIAGAIVAFVFIAIAYFFLPAKPIIATIALIFLLSLLATIKRINQKDIENATKEHRFYNRLSLSKLRLYK